MGLKDEIWASRLEFGSGGLDLGLQAGGGGGTKEEKEEEKEKFPHM